MSDPIIEAPVEDLLEQQAEVTEPAERPAGEVPLEADEADVTEQRWEIRLDEDEYR